MKNIRKKNKDIEKKYNFKIENDKHIIVRIDGHKFSKFTKGLVKPFDKIISEAMIETTKDLLIKFNAVLGYTQSDEITLIIPSLKDRTIDNRQSDKHKLDKRIKSDWKHSYNGRIQKLLSLISSFATMSFNKHFIKSIPRIGFAEPWEFGIENVDINVRHNMWIKYINTLTYEKAGNAFFDAKLKGVLSKEEAFEDIYLRYIDAIKNSKNTFAHTFCSHQELLNLNSDEKISFCLNKTGFDWYSIEDKYKFGCFIKKKENHIPSSKNKTTCVIKKIPVSFILKYIQNKNIQDLLYDNDFINFIFLSSVNIHLLNKYLLKKNSSYFSGVKEGTTVRSLNFGIGKIIDIKRCNINKNDILLYVKFKSENQIKNFCEDGILYSSSECYQTLFYEKEFS